jgi:type II restriction enzyme
VFQYLRDTLTDSITIWEYFVNWHKVLENFRQIEIDLNLLNYLVGKDDIEHQFCNLLNSYPNLVRVIPVLLACRTSNFRILTNYNDGEFNYKSFNLKNKGHLTEQEINNILEFTKQTGLLKLFTDRTIKSIPDYVLGIEVGLDSNGRKNRGGNIMEKIVERQLMLICQQHKLSFIAQATSSKIQTEWEVNIEVDKSSRRFDFAVRNEDRLYLVETNFYGGGGSKLKATAGEYKALFNFITSQGHKFIWITDGLGWKSTLRPLEETFNHIEYILNLKMVLTGLLSAIITQKL